MQFTRYQSYEYFPFGEGGDCEYNKLRSEGEERKSLFQIKLMV